MTLSHRYAAIATRDVADAIFELTGGPISDRRIIRDENGRVTFWARSKNKAAGNRPREFELLGKEFVRRRPTFGRCPDAHSTPGLS